METASLDISLEKSYYKGKPINVVQIGGPLKVKGGFPQDERKHSTFV